MTCSPTEKRVRNISLVNATRCSFVTGVHSTRMPFPATLGREGRQTGSRSDFVAFAIAMTGNVTAAQLATPAAAALFSWSSFVYRERSPADFVAVQGINGCLSLHPIVHLDKAEAFRAARLSVLDTLG